MSTSLQIDRHRRACRMLGFALTLEDDPDAWGGLSTVFQVRLSGFERSCILASVIGSTDTEYLDFVLEHMRARQIIGMPLPPLFDAADEASWWVDHASSEERQAVLVAAFLSLPLRDRSAFLASATRRDAA